MARERFVLDKKCQFDYLYQNRSKDNIGEIINEALECIEESNKSKLEGVFRNIDFNSEGNLGQAKDRNRRLKNLLEDFSDPELNMKPSNIGDLDVIGNVYMYLLERFAADAGKKAVSSIHLMKFLSFLLNCFRPKRGIEFVILPVVLDHCC